MYSIFLREAVGNALDADSKSILVIMVGIAHSSLNENQLTWKEEESLWSAKYSSKKLTSRMASNLELMDLERGGNYLKFQRVWRFKFVFT